MKAAEKGFYHALDINHDVCIGCSHCMKFCPTEAIRVRSGKAEIYENRCVDCGECFKVCPTGAISVKQDDFAKITQFKYRIALIPSTFIGQFPEKIRVSDIYSALKEIGFTDVFEVENSVETYLEARNRYAVHADEDITPLISTFCPAIVRLIQVKFPALVENLILIKAPLDLSTQYIKKKYEEQGISAKDVGVFYITPCAAKIAAIQSPVGEDVSIIDGTINMDYVYNKVYKIIKQRSKDFVAEQAQHQLSAQGIAFTLTGGEKNSFPSECRSLAIDEIHNVIEFLEKLENEEIEGIDFLELRACDQSCAGGILTCGNRFLITERLKNRALKFAKRDETLSHEHSGAKDIRNYMEYMIEHGKAEKIRPRSMMKLDEDINEALKKMSHIREIMEYLPKTDCCVCGSPSCQSLAEDVACEKAALTDCVFIQRNMEARGNMTTEEAISIMTQIWGTQKIEECVKK